MNINWYPGHMKKTKESIKKNLSLVDIVYEVIDARIPFSSQNPEIDGILGRKSRIIILNKSDLADMESNKKWQDYFGKKGISSVIVDCINNRGLEEVIKLSYRLTGERRRHLAKKGIKNRPIRVMIVGVPNVGKSTLINSLSKRKGTKVGNKPGVTRVNQWIRLKGDLELLDTPGILWPKFEDKEVGLNLAFTGAIKDELLDIENLAIKLVERLNAMSKAFIEERYDILVENKAPHDIILEIGKKRGCIVKGGEIDFSKASNIILDEFRKGIIGRITLELPVL
ncbi:Ribosome biogenesis GTPase A [[Clostridium] ultunense Esp]|uniref:Ribosome biogenesis GTPase A n=1 Tax=[Clostridium] ultunense Esp TaxID=1288971 RepID=M1Z3L3_9FIRM|nr:ribosome biogenesis GTPase YlqF [Schnuerera ultunensis]CCQ97470.1 Ribosome biogenesis GTPase A [[Clostridium] ultunense Esp]SHD76995.1 ribosome biogenesis GTPase A [[Clostridium] ultunense Esp]